MKKLFILLTSLMALTITACDSTNSSSVDNNSSDEVVDATYENPVWEPILADPSIIRDENGVWYAFGTQDTADWGSAGYGAKYGPILESHDLVNWDCVGSVFKIA